jgi:hypothetical protein
MLLDQRLVVIASGVPSCSWNVEKNGAGVDTNGFACRQVQEASGSERVRVVRRTIRQASRRLPLL